MPSISRLTALVLCSVALARASPSEDALEARAPCDFYAAQQLSACPTGKQYCSSFLRTYPPLATTTMVVNATTTVKQVDTSTNTVFTPGTATISYSGCNVAPTKRAVAAAAAFGPSCNVKQIAPSKVERACSCIPSFTYRGRRPAPTDTSTVTTTSTAVTVTSFSATVTEVTAPAETFTTFKISISRSGAAGNLRRRYDPAQLAELPNGLAGPRLDLPVGPNPDVFGLLGDSNLQLVLDPSDPNPTKYARFPTGGANFLPVVSSQQTNSPPARIFDCQLFFYFPSEVAYQFMACNDSAEYYWIYTTVPFTNQPGCFNVALYVQ